MDLCLSNWNVPALRLDSIGDPRRHYSEIRSFLARLLEIDLEMTRCFPEFSQPIAAAEGNASNTAEYTLCRVGATPQPIIDDTAHNVAAYFLFGLSDLLWKAVGTPELFPIVALREWVDDNFDVVVQKMREIRFDANEMRRLVARMARERAIVVNASARAKRTEANLDLSAFRPAKEFVGQHEMTSHTKLNRFLEKHQDEIRTYKPNPRRLFVHAGDWAAYWSREGKRQFEALDTDSIAAAAHETARRQDKIREQKRQAGEGRRK
jgi:hypothetical protein